jgi:DNA polymerase-3 subunit delta
VPSLNQAALDERIKQGKLDRVLVLVGDDVKRIDAVIDAIEQTVDAADRPFAVERFHAGEEGAAPVDIIAAARVLPMLGDRRIVFVMRSERLLKPKRASRTTEADDEEDAEAGDESQDTKTIEEYLDAPVPSTTLVFVASEVDRGRRLTKRLIERAAVTEFSGFGFEVVGRGGSEAARWVQDEASRAGRHIDQDAARLLVERAGGDTSKLRGDMDRLVLFTEGRARIGLADVQEVASASDAVEDEWAVVNAIAAGDSARALVETGRRLDRGDSAHALLGQLRWWVAQRLAADDPSRVRAALDALLRTDLALKSSGGDERILIERVVVELTARPVPQRGGWSAGRR